MRSARFVCSLVILCSAMLAAQSNTAALINQPATNKASNGLPDPRTQAKILENYGKLPLSFEANRGQTDARVKFLSHGSGYTLFLTDDEAVFSLHGSKANGEALDASPQLRPTVVPTGNAALRMKLVKANRAAKVSGAEELPGKNNYFIGNDPKKWRTNVPTYAKVKYEGIYSGVDLVYYGNQRQLEYDFVVAPGADPRRIQFDVRGAKSMSRDKDGDLVFDMAEGEVHWHKPVVYQEKDGTRQEITARYVLKDKNRVGFEVADYDLRRPLFIDPLVYSTYLGGSGTDFGTGIAVDSSGNAYVTGFTQSTNFPTMNPLQATYGGGYDAFVAEINPTGSALVYSTYLGGSGDDFGRGIAVDSSGNAYVIGNTLSTDFPTMNPLQPANAGDGDAFVAQLNPTGSALVYSTYLGGSGYDSGLGIAADSSGNALVTGYTLSINFPTMNPLQPANAGGYDAFVAQLNPSGSALVYSTYLGGSGDDLGYGIAVDSSGNAYVTGSTQSTNFPTMNPFQPANAGSGDAFVAKIAKSAAVTLAPPNIDFGIQTVGITSSPQISTLTNRGDLTLTITSIGIKGTDIGNFAQTNNCPSSVPPDGSCQISVTFTPSATGTRNAAVSITDNAPNSPQSLPLTGIGVLPAVTFSPTSLNFGNQGVGTTSSPQVTTLTNSGAGVLTITSIGITGANKGDFAQTNNCPSSVPPNGSCNISVTFTPTATGTRNAAVSVADNAPGSPQSAPLTGVGTPPAVTFSPTNLTFPTQLVFTTSPAQQVTLTNSGAGVLKISHISVASPFSQTNNCPSSLGPGANCTISVKFRPGNKGIFHGTVSVTDNAPGSPQKVPLAGTGTFVQLVPTKLNFGTQPVGTRSLAKKITLTNKGSVTVNISGIAITGTDAGDFAETNTCGKSVASGASCFIKVTFKPLVKGKRTADVSVYDNGGGSPQQAMLIGTGT
jgi:hypothetical protein